MTWILCFFQVCNSQSLIIWNNSVTNKYLPLALILGFSLGAAPLFAGVDDGDKMAPTAKGDKNVVPTLTKEQQLAPCRVENSKDAHVLLTLRDVYSKEGNIRVQVYNNNPDEFLAKGKKILRIDVPAEKKQSIVCVTLPEAGKYALAILHDRNANGKTDFLTEGFGFSRNPKLSFTAPDHEDVVIDIKKGVSKETIKMTYIFKSNEKNRRRKKRR